MPFTLSRGGFPRVKDIFIICDGARDLSCPGRRRIEEPLVLGNLRVRRCEAGEVTLSFDMKPSQPNETQKLGSAFVAHGLTSLGFYMVCTTTARFGFTM